MKTILKGSNQYKVRYAMPVRSRRVRAYHKRHNTNATKNMVHWFTLYGVFLAIVFLSAAGVKHMNQTNAHAQVKIVSPLGNKLSIKKVEVVKKVEAASTAYSKDAIDKTSSEDSCDSRIKLREKIKQYIYSIFSSNARLAYSISLAESGEGCGGEVVYKIKALHHSGDEHSVGIFQVNLYNKNVWVHAGQVPGDTLEQKQAWLEDPYNNAVFSAYLSNKGDDFGAWSTYTSGAYQGFMN
jgi:hypothetical protein